MSSNFCENCGNANEEGSKFCFVCGKVIDQVTPPVTNEQTPPPTQSASNTSAPNTSYTPPVQPAYTAPASNYYQRPINNSPMSIGDYLLAMFLSAIPLVGFILLLVWAFSSDTNINKKNYARAALIMGIIGVAIGIIFGIICAIMVPALIYSLDFNF